MERSLDRQKPSCNDDDLGRMTAFTNDFGQEGSEQVGRWERVPILRQ